MRQYCKQFVAFNSVIVLTLGLVVQSCQSYSRYTVKVKPENGTLAVRAGGDVVFRYRYEQVPFKPYVQQLFTTGGINILRDAPADHLHHHALMYAVVVDGVNFWEEHQQPGRQKHTAFARYVEMGGSGKLHVAGFIEYLDWLKPDSNEVLLKEQRTIKAGWDKSRGVTLLEWQSEFAVPKRKAAVTFTGSHYHGLGMRFVESMDKDGRFSNADGKPGVVFRGDERLVQSNWCAYTAGVDGQPVTVAMFDHPRNPRPATWFTMTRPFAYLSATLALHKEPLKVVADKPLVLQYGVALWDGRVKAEQINNLYQQWTTK